LVADFYCREGFSVVACVAGGAASLLISNELPEDSPEEGARDFLQAIGQKKRCIAIGVSCGLSADYVAGALDQAIDDGHSAIAIGFNHPGASRTARFRSTLKRLSTTDKCFVLTPIIGPEAVAGSSRMKGGSTTLIILYVNSFSYYFRNISISKTRIFCRHYFKQL
jgi:N-acetylmuramic acid 6-phosphate (MurNAc-6-P) etherase